MTSPRLLDPPDVEVGTLPSAPGEAPGMIAEQDEVRTQALKIYKDRGIPFLEKVLASKKTSDRMKLDVVKELRSVAVPPPQLHIGDVNITIVEDLYRPVSQLTGEPDDT